MSKNQVRNFALSDLAFTCADVSQTIWINDQEPLADLQMKLTGGLFVGYDEMHQTAISDSWAGLHDRAKDSLPKDSVFQFFNSEILKWQGMVDNDGAGQVAAVSKGLFYRDITAVRSDQTLFDKILEKPSAFVLMTLLITADNKIVLGKRSYYGDWPNATYECPGSFLKERDIAVGSLTEIAKHKIQDDYVSGGDISVVPLLICDLPRVMETMLLCVSRTSLTAAQMQSDFYTDLLLLDNTLAGKEQVTQMNLAAFHPPSRVALEMYFKYFELTQRLFKSLV